jgi:Fe-S cluster biogenesis protein NfuA
MSANRNDTAEVEARIRDALAGIRPLLPLEVARLELVEFSPDKGVAVLRLAGDCPDCDLTADHLRDGIEAQLRLRVPEVRAVESI